MRRNGFSLVELLTIVTIMSIILGIGGIYFKDMYNKSRIDRQTKEMYADLMGARSQALYQKTPRTVTLVSPTQYTIYPWQTDAASATTLVKNLNYPVTFTAGAVTFDVRGMASATLGICVQPAGNPGFSDSILISPMYIAMGKRNLGGSCATGQIAIQ
jgi:type II secretory pathway pseudopilin PulG